ncbi:NADH-quinone oxidoreductase subunit C [Streptomyces sp. NPDC058664]|uniref:NADH-quinone oxidoreductase subunit C n=1 Tax=unclassified Streptomyces TaxID=2593676 RepID=UPI00365EC75B
MTAYDSLPEAVTEVFGEEATAERAYDLLTVDVPPASWITALETARDALGCTYFDWLSAVDEPGTGFRVCAHVVSLASLAEGGPRRLLVRTTVPHSAAVLPTAIGVYAGAGWHERETHEMFGVDFTGHPHLVPLLLPENFEGHPLRKDFVLAARVAKAWPGAKEPGESHDGGPKRRQMLPPGVPDPNEWGPLKGQLPPAPTRPARAAAGDRPARRTRSVGEGSASRTSAVTPAPDAATEPPSPTTRPPRRSRSVSEGSASQSAAADPTPEQAAAAPEPGTATDTPPATRPPRRTRSASEGSASRPTPAPTDAPAPETPRPPRRTRSAADGSASQATPNGPAPSAETTGPRTRSSDAPWHHARPAFDDEPASRKSPAKPETPAGAEGPEAERPEPQTPDPATRPEPQAPETASEPTEPGTGPQPPEAAPESAASGPSEPAAPAPQAAGPRSAPPAGREAVAPDSEPDEPAAPQGPAESDEPPAPQGPAPQGGGTDHPTTPAGGDPA